MGNRCDRRLGNRRYRCDGRITVRTIAVRGAIVVVVAIAAAVGAGVGIRIGAHVEVEIAIANAVAKELIRH